MEFGWPGYLDFPEYIEKFPDKDMWDWQHYRGEIVYKKAKQILEGNAVKFSNVEIQDLQKDLDYLEEKYGN